jgi:two-component system, cell cycle response regulator
MDASILVVGGEDFRSPLIDSVRHLAAFTIEVAANPGEALPLIQAQQPDILLIQVGLVGSLELCQQVKAQNRLAWIYCILLDCQPKKTRQDNQDMLQAWKSEAEARAIALEIGADAYLQLPSEEVVTMLDIPLGNRLIQAQVWAGLRQVRNYRELVRANDVLSAIALSDPLTELNNRRAFEWELPRQIQNARNRDVPISLLMMDIDFFKTINDTYGHLVGDRTLQLFAARLRHNLRFYDTPFRYGGEEFAIILSDTACTEAVMIAHRLCQLISEQPFAINEKLDLTITVSAGAATLRLEDDGKGISLLQRADERLLQAKAQGRDRVVGCSELGCGSLCCTAKG